MRRRRNGLTVSAAGHRYVFLTALRWLPTGITVPVTVILASSRGLSAADIGLVFATYSLVCLLLELPTGGLADAIGRRPVLVLSAVLQIASMLSLALAHDLLGFALAMALNGVARALDSGPLESWYVDAVFHLDETADVTTGLSRAGVANGGGLALGAVIGGLAPSLAARIGGNGNVLVVPFLVAAAIEVGYLVAVLVLVVRFTPASGRSVAGEIRTGVGTVPAIIRDTLRVSARDRVLRRLLMITFLIGTVLSMLELIGPLRFTQLSGSRTDGTAVFGVVMAVSFAAAGLGAGLATLARRAAGGSAARANVVVFALCAVAVTAVALAPGTALAGVAYAFFYLFNGAGWPLRQQLMHSQVTAERRSTTVSANSFAFMIGAVTGSLLLPRLAEAASLTVALHAGAAPLLLAGLIALRLRSGHRHDHLAGAPGVGDPVGVGNVGQREPVSDAHLGMQVPPHEVLR